MKEVKIRMINIVKKKRKEIDTLVEISLEVVTSEEPSALQH